MTGWSVGRWGLEKVARGHPVNPVHPVCGEGKGQDGRMTGWSVRRWGMEKVARNHPVNPVHPVCGEEEDRMAGGQDGRMECGKVGNADGGEESSCKSCASCLRGRRGQDGRRTGWSVGRWGMEKVAKSHPVNPVHPVC